MLVLCKFIRQSRMNKKLKALVEQSMKQHRSPTLTVRLHCLAVCPFLRW
jgi:hypothetical protein